MALMIKIRLILSRHGNTWDHGTRSFKLCLFTSDFRLICKAVQLCGSHLEIKKSKINMLKWFCAIKMFNYITMMIKLWCWKWSVASLNTIPMPLPAPMLVKLNVAHISTPICIQWNMVLFQIFALANTMYLKVIPSQCDWPYNRVSQQYQNSGGINWKYIFDPQDWVQKLTRTKEHYTNLTLGGQICISTF